MILLVECLHPMGFPQVQLLMSKIWCFLKVAWWLYVGRLLVGCGIGLLSYVVNFVTVLYVMIAVQMIFSHSRNTHTT